MTTEKLFPPDDRSQQARADAQLLEAIASTLSYNETPGETTAKHQLREIAMRIRTGYYYDGDRTPSLFGLNVYEDKTLPPNMVVFHTQDGKPPTVVHLLPDDTEGGDPS